MSWTKRIKPLAMVGLICILILFSMSSTIACIYLYNENMELDLQLAIREVEVEYYETHIELLRDPTHQEVSDFLENDSTDMHEYKKPEYTCRNFAQNTIENAIRDGYHCAYVKISYKNHKTGHAVIAFNTTDMGTVFIEPQSDSEIYLYVGGSYNSKIISKLNIRW